MLSSNWLRSKPVVLIILAAVAMLASPWGVVAIVAQQVAPTSTTAYANKPVLGESANEPPPPPQNHPLLPAMKIAYNSLDFLEKQVADYSARVVKQERIDGRLRGMQYIDAKVRHAVVQNGEVIKPFGVYLNYRAPDALAGREVLWVAGENGGDMVVRRGGKRFEYLTVTVSPESDSVARDSRYLISDMGMKKMVERLIEIGRDDMRYGECEVQFYKDVKIDGRSCTLIQVVHPERRPQFKFNVARIYVDNQYPIPLRYEAYDWPENPGGEPQLTESYTFQNVKLNPGFSDEEFRRSYTGYKFRE